VNSRFGGICIALVCAVLVTACATAKLHRDGIEDFDHGRYELGLQKLEQAAAGDPSNLTYRLDVTSRHAEAIQKLMTAGDKARAAGDLDAAAAAYQRVLTIESPQIRATKALEGIETDRRHAQTLATAEQEFKAGNVDMADAHLNSILADDPGYAAATALRSKIAAARGPVLLTPKLHTRDNRPVTLQFRDAPTKMVFEVLSRQTGINFIFDKDIKSDGKTTIYVQDVPIEQAIDLVLGQNQLARQILSENMVLIYPNTSTKQKDYQDEIVKTFYLNTAAPKDVADLLKTVLDAKTLVVNERASAIVMRDTPENVRMAEKLVESVDISEPEVMMEVEILEISRSKMQQLGITYPNTATLSVNPLNGGTNLTLSDLKNQNSDTITVSPLSVTIDALKTTSAANLLASPRIRARNKEKARVLIGSKVPVITTAATASGNGGIVSNTQVQYLDVGLTLEVEPMIYSDNDVAIGINLIVSSISNTVKVGDTVAYELSNRNATTKLELKDGETQILAGLINDTESRSATSVPGLGDIPIIGRLFSNNNTSRDKSELVMSITPHVIRAKSRPPGETTEFWYGTESRSGLEPLRISNAPPAPPGAAGTVSGPSAAAAGTVANASTASGAQATRTAVDVSTMASDTVVGGVALVGAAAGAAGAAAAGAAPSARLAALQGVSEVPSGKPTESDGPVPHVTATLVGPKDVKVGDEFTVTLQVQTDQSLGKTRSQLRFDATAFQILSGDPGGMVPSSAGAKVIGRSGGAQLDVTVPSGESMSGSGDFMVMRFKALQARGQTAFAAQVTVIGASGAIMANSTPTPLTLIVSN
jgi:general secretion pathway protein D